MQNICVYQIEVKGELDENAFNATSPIQIHLVRQDRSLALFTVLADQSGLIGLIRYMHGQGFLLLSVSRDG